MSEFLPAVIVAAYIYLMIRGRHTKSSSFFIGILCILGMFIARAIVMGRISDGGTMRGMGAIAEILLGVAFLCLVICLPSANMDRKVSEEVKHILGNVFQKASEGAKKSETNDDSST